MRCEGRQSEGTGYSSGRLRASAFTFLAPGTCETSKVMRAAQYALALDQGVFCGEHFIKTRFGPSVVAE